MKKTKILAICTTLIMSVSLFTGCGKKTNDKGYASQKKDTTISMLFCDIPNAPYKKDWKSLQYIKEATGVTLDLQVVPTSGFSMKADMLFNSGNVPDIVTHTYPTSALMLSGQLLPINKYIDKLPNLKKHMEETKTWDIWNSKKCVDGYIYELPTLLHDYSYQSHQWSIRKDIFEKNNIPIPKTLDEVLAAGKKLKEIYPDSTPITNRYGSKNIMGGLSSAFGTIGGATLGDGIYYNRDKKDYEFAPISQGWKDMLTFTNKLYTSGVLDQEYASLDSSVYEQKVINGSTFILYDYTQNNNKYENEGKKLNPDYDLEIIYPPTGYDNKYAVQWQDPWSISCVLPSSLEEDEEHLNEVLEYLNWCYSDEAETLLTWGKEGETYEVVDGVKKFKCGDGLNIKEFGLPHNCITLREDVNLYLNPLAKDEREIIEKASRECVPLTPPGTPLTEDGLDSIKIYQSTLSDYCSTMMEKFINGSEPLSNWDAFVKSCKDKGADKLLNTYKTALKNKK